MLVLDFDHGISYEAMIDFQRRLNYASAAHSTHSHLRATDKNPNAEPRFPFIAPLATPIPADKYPALWRWAAGFNGVIVDAQDINDDGAITGRAVNPATGKITAFVAVPILETETAKKAGWPAIRPKS